MNNQEKKEEFTTCLACIGSGDIYDAVEETVNPCPYCSATGEATAAENEIFLSKEINYN